MNNKQREQETKDVVWRRKGGEGGEMVTQRLTGCRKAEGNALADVAVLVSLGRISI